MMPDKNAWSDLPNLKARLPTEEQRRLSMIPKEKFDKWFQQFWTITARLVQMFSFTGDTVLDPFCGTATTMVAALKHGRNSIGVELDTDYCKMAASRLMNENRSLFGQVSELLTQRLDGPDGRLQDDAAGAFQRVSVGARGGAGEFPREG